MISLGHDYIKAIHRDVQYKMTNKSKNYKSFNFIKYSTKIL